MYRRLDVERVLETAERLEHRIDERFPGSGLHKVARELVAIVRDGRDRLHGLRQPFWGVRVASWLAAIFLIVILGTLAILALRTTSEVGSQADLLQANQALLDEIVLVGIAVTFLLGLENRARRSATLKALHQYRSVAHVIDMHQLTKDPEPVSYPTAARTASSPRRDMTRLELGRYLDYCSELLSLTSKMAALHAQDLRDPVVLETVRDVESLVGDLQAKIWQKKLILDVAGSPGGERLASGLASPAEAVPTAPVAATATAASAPRSE